MNEEKAIILIVDDTVNNIDVLVRLLRPHYDTVVAKSGSQALKRLEKSPLPALILLDIMMPGIDGFETCRRIKANPDIAHIPIIFLTAKTERKDLVEGFQLGAVDYLTKQFNQTELLVRVKTHVTVSRLRNQLEERNQQLTDELKVIRELYRAAWERVHGDLLGDSQAIRTLRHQIECCAATFAPVLLSGPAGAGEEAAARAIHMASSQRDRLFLHINCARQTDDDEGQGLHNRLNAQTPGGTLFIDGLQHMDPSSQRDLLTLVTQAEPTTKIIAFLPDGIGEEDTITAKIDASLLEALTQHEIRVPSLAERHEDIPVLVNHFVQEYAHRAGKYLKGVTPESMARVKNYGWPRNIRQLRSVIEKVVATSVTSRAEITDEILYGGEHVGRYQLFERIGRGGMGEVWMAQHELLARPVALKLIRNDLGLDPDARQTTYKRFEQEAMMMAKLQSPNTIRLFDYGITEHSEFYLVMELLQGMDVHSMVVNHGPIQAERVVMLLQQACRSLMEAHAIGLVHRDIKPHNLFVCKKGAEYDFLKVLDFGIVKPHDDVNNLDQADGDYVLGSVNTTAPEMLRKPEDATHLSDIYSLGCTAYWMLTGKHIFQAESITSMAWQHIHTRPEPPKAVVNFQIPDEVSTIIMDCLEKEQSRRPPSAYVLWERLEHYASKNRWTQKRASKWWQRCAPDVDHEGYVMPPSTLHRINLQGHNLNGNGAVSGDMLSKTKELRYKHTETSWNRVFGDDVDPLDEVDAEE